MSDNAMRIFESNRCQCCGAGAHNGYEHHRCCRLQLHKHGRHKQLAPYWWEGWNRTLLGLSSRWGDGSPEDIAYGMGATMVHERLLASEKGNAPPPTVRHALRPAA